MNIGDLIDSILSVSLIDWGLMAWPVNGCVLALFVLGLAAMHGFRHKVCLFRWLGSTASAVSVLAATVAVTMVLGLVTQAPASDIETAWIHRLLSAWPFVLVYVWLTVSLGLTILRVGSRRWTWRTVGFMLNHVGLFVALVAATLGNADMQQLKMYCYPDLSEGQGVRCDQSCEIVELPFAVELHQFTLEEYMSGMPKRFASDVTVFAKGHKGNEEILAQGTVEVNKPLNTSGWEIYQYNYDETCGYSVFLLVRDPWLPAVYMGIYMLLAGAVLMIAQAVVQRGLKSRGSKITVGALLLFFGITAYAFIPIMTNKQLVPALQSPWFAPHVLVYMFAYTLMGAAALIAVWELIRNGRKLSILNSQFSSILDTLVHIGNALFAIGMLFGALWAKEAWGHYWSWDPKETWAAVTWFAYLDYIHYRLHSPESRNIPLIIIILSFLLLNMCWWGINFLPSAQATSVHIYNM